MFALGSFEESEAPAWGFPLALSLSQRLQWREGSILRQSGKKRSKDYSRSSVGGGLITKLLFNDVCCFGNWLPVRRTLWITDGAGFRVGFPLTQCAFWSLASDISVGVPTTKCSFLSCE